MKKNIVNSEIVNNFDDNLKTIELLLSEIELPNIKLEELELKNKQIKLLIEQAELQLKKVDN